MYLDEELLKMCEEFEFTSPEDVVKIHENVYSKCEHYYTSKLAELSVKSAYNVKAILDRTFNLYDSFVKMALKHKEPTVVILGEMFQECNFKDAFLKHPKLKELYNNL